MPFRDAAALNIGSTESWQQEQVKNAYDAASAVGMLVFISFDYSSFPCDAGLSVSVVKDHKDKPAQFKVDSLPMVSSFLGACIGPSGWQKIKSETGAYLMPFIEGGPQEVSGSKWSVLQSWLCWDCGWSQGDPVSNADQDRSYLNALGSGRFATTVSPWFYIHYRTSNRCFPTNHNWLSTRWEQVIAMSKDIRFVEINTWNDFGESHYLGPTTSGIQPQGTTWVNNFPHTPWLEMSRYYIQLFKTGNVPLSFNDQIYFWLRPHPKDIQASNDPWANLLDGRQPRFVRNNVRGTPFSPHWRHQDKLWAVVFCQTYGGDCNARLTVGGTHKTFDELQPGPNKLELPLDGHSFGDVNVQVYRDGKTVIDYTPNDFSYKHSTEKYNYNAYVGYASS
ncbi:hypothetical protein PM082_017611 [Marasmius tenuissimus]|nr:hypothetical protein PM082_017611 [Marasmius tenuissimus]